ncbi:hypothetical protein K9F62_05380 [Desulfovibrio sp. JY]|nr:hypothetical protein K9F62_05380 [Desulfovibrio sp. JY]
MRIRLTPLLTSLFLATALCAVPALAKKGQGQQGQAPSYGPPSYSGHKGDQTPPYGPPSYAGQKGNQASPKGKSSYVGPGKNYDSNGDMPPGQQKKQSKHKKKKHRNSPPDQAPAWGYRNQE